MSSSKNEESENRADEKQPQGSSPLEKCSFACHLLLFPIGLTYFFWLTIPQEIIESSFGENYCPNRDYALHIPVSALFLFLAAPFLYAALNSFTVPNLTSIETVEDVYAKSSSKTQILSKKMPPTESILPDICDLDPSTLIWHGCNRN